jgi:sugar lactone lactonase YvrE
MTMEQDTLPTIICDIRCELGEGPTFDPLSGKLFWFDIENRKLLEKSWPDGATIVHEFPFMASAMAIVDSGHQLVATENGLHIRESETGKLTLHTALEADNTVTRSNDGRVHPCGAFWIGTMGKKAERKAGAIYWFFKGELRRIFPDITIPNSICFSVDGSVAYFTDSQKGILFRVDCDPQTGLPSGEPKVFVDHRRQQGALDGSVIDADGQLWNARWGAGAVDVYDSGGKRVASHAVPARQPSCPAFAGVDAASIIVTTAMQGLNAEDRRTDEHAGKTFLLGLPVRGRFEPRVVIK